MSRERLERSWPPRDSKTASRSKVFGQVAESVDQMNGQTTVDRKRSASLEAKTEAYVSLPGR